MNVSIKPSTSNETMFSCESALPFLTGLPARDAHGRRALAGVALGAAVALTACERAVEPAPQPPPPDKVSAAFSKLEREIERAKARLSRAEPSARRDADAGSAARP
jgi:hypothetical protein